MVDPVFRETPQFEDDPLSDHLGCRLTLKVETANPIRSFKGRGADYFLHQAAATGEDRVMVCASAGNFGQAMAYACRNRGRRLVVYAAETANPVKVARMRSLGAEVRQVGRDFDAAKEEARRHAEETGGWMVEDGREAAISEGAGSIAVELSRLDGFDAMVIPLGNGALLAGMARWVEETDPGTEMIGVCARGADAMERSWRAGRPVTRPRTGTIADGIAVRVPVPEAVEDMRGIVDDVVLVDDEQILAAMSLLFRLSGQLVEPAGAAGVAALLADRPRFAGARVATVLCGSNIAPGLAERLLDPGN